MWATASELEVKTWPLSADYFLQPNGHPTVLLPIAYQTNPWKLNKISAGVPIEQWTHALDKARLRSTIERRKETNALKADIAG
ncbi:hypothetical protein DFQ28_003563 [Apophysomyces sp. BC1034]|nr:hypothetical protein DFQ28_003563 [Apophysomyces sp. BC1034]